MILVTGGTGTLGTLLVPKLLSRGRDLRVLTRDAARATHLEGARVEVLIGDLRDPTSVQRAVFDAETVVLAAHGFIGPGGVSPASVDRDANMQLIDAASRAGADVVLISIVGAGPDHPMELFRMKYAAEQHLRASSVRWSIVRSHAFLETWIGVLCQTAARSGRPLVFGRGRNPINFVSAVDVAEIVAHVVTDPAMRGNTIELGGPDDLTMDELAEAVQIAAGRSSSPRHVPRLALHITARTLSRLRPQRAGMARAALAMDSLDFTFDPTDSYVGGLPLPTTTVSELLAPAKRQLL